MRKFIFLKCPQDRIIEQTWKYKRPACMQNQLICKHIVFVLCLIAHVCNYDTICTFEFHPNNHPQPLMLVVFFSRNVRKIFTNLLIYHQQAFFYAFSIATRFVNISIEKCDTHAPHVLAAGNGKRKAMFKTQIKNH
jgi:hypothetical protein